MDQYPQRESFFIARFLRTLHNVGAHKEIGWDGFGLLTYVVTIEDRLRYRKAAKIYNRELMRCFDASEDTVNRSRKKCIDHGWLQYSPGRKGIPGTYWVTIPEFAAELDDVDLVCHQGSEFTRKSAGESAGENGFTRKDEGESRGESAGTSAGHSIPKPNPNKKRRVRVANPTASSPSKDVQNVWAEYQEKHPRSKLTADRRRLITRRLKEFTPDELIDAIRGNHVDEFCCGQNDSGKEYHDIELCLRDAKHVEDYAKTWLHRKNGKGTVAVAPPPPRRTVRRKS